MFEIDKCTMLMLKKGKRKTTKEIKLTNHEIIRSLNEIENYNWIF